MSIRVREWLKLMGLFHLTNHEERVEIDKEIERRTGRYCDNAIDKGLINKREFENIVNLILKRRRKRGKEAQIIV